MIVESPEKAAHLIADALAKNLLDKKKNLSPQLKDLPWKELDKMFRDAECADYHKEAYLIAYNVLHELSKKPI